MINAFITCAPEDLDVELIGITSDPTDPRLGSWQEVEVEGRPLKWFPLMVDHPSIRARIPLSLRYTWKLRRARRQFDLSKVSHLFHRLEPAWATGDIDAQKLMFLHYHVQDQILSSNTEVTWSRFPAVYFAMEKRILPKMDYLWSERSDGIAWWKEHYPALQEKADWLPTWADDRVFHPRPSNECHEIRGRLCTALGANPKHDVAFFAARFEGQNHPMLLMETWQRLCEVRPSAQLILAGDGSLKKSMQNFVGQHGLEKNVFFAGTLNQDQVARWQNAADVFVLSSAFEGMALSMIEALAAGVPVVTTKVGEAPRVITKPEHGRIVEERCAAALAQALDQVLSQDRDRQACVKAAEPYTPRKVLAPVYQAIRNYHQQHNQ